MVAKITTRVAIRIRTIHQRAWRTMGDVVDDVVDVNIAPIEWIGTKSDVGEWAVDEIASRL